MPPTPRTLRARSVLGRRTRRRSLGGGETAGSGTLRRRRGAGESHREVGQGATAPGRERRGQSESHLGGGSRDKGRRAWEGDGPRDPWLEVKGEGGRGDVSEGEGGRGVVVRREEGGPGEGDRRVVAWKGRGARGVQPSGVAPGSHPRRGVSPRELRLGEKRGCPQGGGWLLRGKNGTTGLRCRGNMASRKISQKEKTSELARRNL